MVPLRQLLGFSAGLARHVSQAHSISKRSASRPAPSGLRVVVEIHRHRVGGAYSAQRGPLPLPPKDQLIPLERLHRAHELLVAATHLQAWLDALELVLV